MITRRRFLIASGVVGGAALAAGTVGVYTLNDILDTARLGTIRRADAGTLVLITLYGGNDGLSTVVPYADPAYRAARGDLAYRAEEVLRLNDSVGLSPAFEGFKRIFDRGRLAVIRGVGYPKPNRSHFRSMDIWQTAQPDRPGTTGWLGRWLDVTPGAEPRHAVTFEPVLPPLLAGATTAGASVGLTRSRLPGGYRANTLAALGRAVPGEPLLRARAAQAFADLVAVDRMAHALRDAAPTPDGADRAPERADGTATGGRTVLADQLELIARCVEAGVTTRVYSASLGGFDLHADGRQAQRALLAEVDRAVSWFVDRMERTDRGRRVVVAIYSEFGRRVRANASEGTDHGAASDVLVLGGPVRGGLYGEPPSLTDLDDGDLRFTTDFRAVYATLLANVLDTEPERVLGGWTGQLTGLLT